MDSDDDSWVDLDSDNPADTSDDDAGVIALSSGCTTPDCPSDDDDDGSVLALSSGRTTPDCPSDDVEGVYEPSDAEEVPQPTSPGPAPLSGLFHHTPDGGVLYAAFDPVDDQRSKVLIPDPAFSACNEDVTVLASTRGLVCLLARETGVYVVADPAAYTRVRLPRHSRDHHAFGDPAVVVVFEEDDEPESTCDVHQGNYHVVVAFPLGDGIYAFESFCSRTWEWAVAEDALSPVEQVVSASGVGAMGRAFWRTTLGCLLCYDPRNRTADTVPAPQEVLQWPCWELGEMKDALCVVCMDDRATEVVIVKLRRLEPLEEDGSGESVVVWSLAEHFEGGCLRNRHDVQLLRSQGPEVVMWDPTLELVVAMDTDGRTTRTIGPLSGLQYYSDFIPYVSSATGTRLEAGVDCTFTAAAAEA